MKRTLKPLLIFLTMANLSWIVPTWNARNREKSSNRVAAQAKRMASDTQQVQQTVLDFLNWYKINCEAINRIVLVEQALGKPYSVNRKNSERYLTYLKSSHLLTDGFLDQFRAFFRERNIAFQQNPQFEGPPDGFEFDLIMLNQEVDKQLDSLDSLQMGKVSMNPEQAVVGFTLLDAYEFRLEQQNGRWLIAEILNSGQE